MSHQSAQPNSHIDIQDSVIDEIIKAVTGDDKKESIKKESIEKEINKHIANGATPLILAAIYGEMEIAKRLLEEKGIGIDIDIDAVDRDGNTSLMWALSNSNEEIAGLLLENKANVDAKNKKDTTALMLASHNGFTKVVGLLLEHKADVNATTRKGNSSALMSASKNGRKEIVRLLLEHKADVNAKNKNDETALMLASGNGHAEIVELLLKKEGIQVNEKDSAGSSALTHAIYNGREKIVELLLNNGADLKIKTRKGGKTLLMLASAYGRQGIAELLLEKGANINEKDSEGKTALTLASQNSDAQIVTLLANKMFEGDFNEDTFNQLQGLRNTEGDNQEAIKSTIDDIIEKMEDTKKNNLLIEAEKVISYKKSSTFSFFNIFNDSMKFDQHLHLKEITENKMLFAYLVTDTRGYLCETPRYTRLRNEYDTKISQNDGALEMGEMT